MERSQNGIWKAIDPGLVLDPGDLLRFRFRTTFDGYLYVIDAGTSGAQTLSFPATTPAATTTSSPARYTRPVHQRVFQSRRTYRARHHLLAAEPVPLGGNPAAALGTAQARVPRAN